MSRARVFIDGHAGTVGLRIHESLQLGDEIELLDLDDERRKDPAARRALASDADLVVLCLPDPAAREALSFIEGSDTRVVDCSTAHRVDSGFTFGLPELEPGQRARIAAARRVTNPGCYPVSVILTLRPLVEAGILAADAPISIHGLSGYTGGGRPLIERWEDPGTRLASLPHEAPYALEHVHKHVPEMVEYARLAHTPQFVPAVGPFRCGMRVEVPLHASMLAAGADAKRVWDVLDARYAGETFVQLRPFRDPFETDEWTLDPQACNGTNRVDLAVVPHPNGHVLLVGLLDNLGKGACGNAIQCLNLMLGLPEERGLRT